MSKKLYELTEEHKQHLAPTAKKWIDNALNCAPMDDIDKAQMTKAINGLYTAAGLNPPKNIVFVPSPFILKVAGGFAAAIWWKHKNSTVTEQATRETTEQATLQTTWQATEQATREATRQATEQATLRATEQATWQATEQATREATRQATEQATREATRQATEQATLRATEQATWQATEQATWQATLQATLQTTWQATEQATREATRKATEQATEWVTEQHDGWFEFNLDIPALARELGLGLFGVRCVANSYYMQQSGNQGSTWVSHLSFFRHVVKLPLSWSKWDSWEKAAVHGGPRIMHPDFCMVSDRPLYIKQDSQNRPHCYDGPFIEWRDGSRIFAIHGVYVPSQYCLTPAEKINIQEVIAESNSEVRMAVMQKIGMERVYKKLGGKKVGSCQLSPDKINDLLEIELGSGLMVRGLMVSWTDKFSAKKTFLPVPREKEDFNPRWQELYGEDWDGDPESAKDVTFWTFGIPPGTPIHQHT